MHAKRTSRRRGFTLVELLTVIMIISLLIGLLVPAIARARDLARKVHTQSLLSAVGKGCEMFHNDMGMYPRSSGGNPFEAANYPPRQPPAVPLSGAQWLVLQLAGADLQGYIKATGTPTAQDWLNWYNPQWVPPAGQSAPTRLARYFEASGKIVKSPENFAREQALTLPPALTAGASDWNNGRLPFVVDAYGNPVLYYAADEQAKQPFASWSTSARSPGRYDQRDNAAFTGDASGQTGLDLGGGPHPMRVLAWSADPARAPAKLDDQPEQGSFAGCVYDRGMFELNEQGNKGQAWPYRPDTFLLYSPGRDGVYGTRDDVTTFD